MLGLELAPGIELVTLLDASGILDESNPPDGLVEDEVGAVDEAMDADGDDVIDEAVDDVEPANWESVESIDDGDDDDDEVIELAVASSSLGDHSNFETAEEIMMPNMTSMPKPKTLPPAMRIALRCVPADIGGAECCGSG